MIQIRPIVREAMMDSEDSTVIVCSAGRAVGHLVSRALQHHVLQRIAVRDADHWPALARAMTMACPVWTDEADLFGTGLAT